MSWRYHACCQNHKYKFPIGWSLSVFVCEVTLVVSDSLRPDWPQPTRLLSPWDSLGRNTGVVWHSISPGHLSDPGIKPASFMSPILEGEFFTTSANWGALDGIYQWQFHQNNDWTLFGGKDFLEYLSVQFSHSVMSDNLQPHESQHSRTPCPSPTPGVHANSCSLSRWCHPAISSSVIPFSSCPQSLSASGSFPMNQLFAWGNQSIAVSSSASVLPMNTQGWAPLGWTGWTSLQAKGLPRVFSNATVQKHQFFGAQLSSQSNSHIHTWSLEKP